MEQNRHVLFRAALRKPYLTLNQEGQTSLFYTSEFVFPASAPDFEQASPVWHRHWMASGGTSKEAQGLGLWWALILDLSLYFLLSAR